MNRTNLFVEVLIDDVDKRFNFLIEELLHMSYIVRFFHFRSKQEGREECNFRFVMFKKMWRIIKKCKEDLFNYNNFNEFFHRLQLLQFLQQLNFYPI